MERFEFDGLFLDVLANPLRQVGFEFVRKSKTLRLVEGNFELRWIRLGGKATSPGSMATAICARYTFLRPVQTDDPNNELLGSSDFLWELTFDDFRGSYRNKMNYRRLKERAYCGDRFEYHSLAREVVIEKLVEMRVMFEKRIIPWAQSRNPRTDYASLKKLGEDAWCERRWIEDFERYLDIDPPLRNPIKEFFWKYLG